MAKKRTCSYDNHPPAARRYPNDSVNGMGSTAIFPNQIVTNQREKIGTNDIPLPGQEPPDFLYDMHKGPGTQRRGK